MARSTDAKHRCPLYNRDIYWGECYEVQEVREDEMGAKWLREPFELGKANETCEKCRWYAVNADE